MLPHGLRLAWAGDEADVDPAPDAPSGGAHATRIPLGPGSFGVAYGPLTPAQAQSVVRAVAQGRLPPEPALPWCAVVRDEAGILAAASTQFSSGLFWRSGPLVVATDPRSAAGPDPVVDLDVVRVLASGAHEPERTVYAGVRRLPPGSLARFARPDAAPTVALAMDDWPEPGLRGAAAEEALLSALEQACADAGSVGPASLMLSAGLDSTMLASLLVDTGPVTGYTYRPVPQARLWRADGADADEGPLVHAWAEELGPRLAVVDLIAPPDARPLEVARQAFERSGVPVHNPANQWWLDEARRRAAAAGSSVVVTGAHGNAAFSYDHPYAVAWALRRRRLADVVAMGRDGDGRLSMPLLRRRVLRPLRPHGSEPSSRPFVNGATSGAGVHDRPAYLAWLGRRLTGLPAAGNPAAVEGTLLVDPFAAPGVLRAAAAIDPVEWRLGGRGRALARRLAKGRVPDRLRLRTTRGQQGRDAWWLVRADRDDYLDRIATARNLAGFEAVEWGSVRERVAAWPWATPEPPDWHEQVAVDRLLSLAEFTAWAGSDGGRTLD